MLLEKEQPEQQPGTHHHLERSVSPDVHHHLERSVGPDVSGSLTALTRCGLGGPGRAGDSGLCSPHSSIASLKSNSSSPAAISENKRGRVRDFGLSRGQDGCDREREGGCGCGQRRGWLNTSKCRQVRWWTRKKCQSGRWEWQLDRLERHLEAFVLSNCGLVIKTDIAVVGIVQ